MKLLTCMPLLAAVIAHGATQRFEWSQIAPLPNPHGVAAPFAGVSGGALLVAGGANFPDAKPWEGGKKVWHRDVWVLDYPNATWKRGGQLPRPLAYGVSITHRDEVICAGGSDETKLYSNVFALAWRGGQLRTRALPSLPQPIANGCGALLNETLYVAGGINTPAATNASSGFFALDLNESNLTWRVLPTWPGSPRMLALAAAHDGAFFLVGGAALHASERGPVREYLRDGFRFDPKNGWKQIAGLPFPAAAAPSPAPTFGGDTFFLLASDDGSGANVPAFAEHPGFDNRLLAYDVKRNTWTPISTNPAPRVTVPVVPWLGQWIVPSGEVRPGVRSPEISRLRIASPR